jgi:orotidine-5'-phosphate decarboxylase
MNLAFYAGFGAEGLKGLKETNDYIRRNHPAIPIFADCKRSEMGESVDMVRREIFDELGFNCVMVTPWFGYDTIRDYLAIAIHLLMRYRISSLWEDTLPKDATTYPLRPSPSRWRCMSTSLKRPFATGTRTEM